MMQAKNHKDRRYYYDNVYDDLTIKFNNAPNVYTDEVSNDIYIVKNEENDQIVAVQILYFKERNDSVLRKYLPEDIYHIVNDIKCKIK